MDNETPVGELLFRFMMKNAVIGTRTTNTCLRENLANLDTYMHTFNSYIENFYQYVKVNVDGLKTTGERKDGLIINLFKDY